MPHVLAAVASSPITVHSPWHINDATWIAMLTGVILGFALCRKIG